MPKAKRFILAKDESTGVPLLQCISLGDPSHFADVGKPRRAYRPRVMPYKPVAGCREELARLQELDVFRTCLLREDYTKEQQRKKLADRISSPPPPLIERIAPAEETLPVKITPIPDHLHFHTKSQVHRIRDFKRKFAGTKTHLEPFFELLDKCQDQVPHHIREVLFRFADRFNFLYKHLEEIVEKRDVTTAQWKLIDRELKKAGQHKFKQLKPRFLEHCTELVEELGTEWLKFDDDE